MADQSNFKYLDPFLSLDLQWIIHLIFQSKSVIRNILNQHYGSCQYRRGATYRKSVGKMMSRYLTHRLKCWDDWNAASESCSSHKTHGIPCKWNQIITIPTRIINDRLLTRLAKNAPIGAATTPPIINPKTIGQLSTPTKTGIHRCWKSNKNSVVFTVPIVSLGFFPW